MPATLAQIDAALYAALTPLLCTGTSGPSDSKPFASLDRFAGDLNEDTIRQTCAQFPACLLRYDGEAAVRDIDVDSGDSEERGAAQWTVLVAVEDPRSVTDGVVGATGVPGALSCIGLVLTACNALLVSGLWRWRRVRYVDTRPLLVRRGALYVYGVRFEALRAVEQATPTDTSVPITELDADVNLVAPTGGDPPTNPVAQLRFV